MSVMVRDQRMDEVMVFFAAKAPGIDCQFAIDPHYSDNIRR